MPSRLSYERADLAAKVRQARKTAGQVRGPNKQIFVITDMQKLSWEGLKTEARSRGRTPDAGSSAAEQKDAARSPSSSSTATARPSPTWPCRREARGGRARGRAAGEGRLPSC